jgi:hypothetical protein
MRSPYYFAFFFAKSNRVKYGQPLSLCMRGWELMARLSTHPGNENVVHGRRIDGKIIRS